MNMLMEPVYIFISAAWKDWKQYSLVLLFIHFTSLTTGVVLDQQGNIVTNYHVLQSVLKGLGDNPNGKRVARVTLLRPDGVQQSFDGILVSLYHEFNAYMSYF